MKTFFICQPLYRTHSEATTLYEISYGHARPVPVRLSDMYDSSPERHTPPGPAPFNQDHDITCARVHAAVIDDIPQISDQLTAVAGHISDLLGHVRKITGSEDETATRALYTTHRSLENILEDLEHTMRHVRGRTPQ